jgi:FKBP-type peptidyl-prolyl cis-trans isomerase
MISLFGDIDAQGIKIREIRVGDGEVATGDSITTIRFEGTLKKGERFGDGTETIDLRRRETIAGLRYGFEGMRVGGRQWIAIGPHLAYGKAGCLAASQPTPS